MRRSTPLLAVLLLLAGAAAAQDRPPAGTARAQSTFWFDPTQLPTFTGTVERYLLNPAGEVDALLFREGPQVVFPPDVAEAVRAAAPIGRPLIVWGIRARSAPVITMLAFAATAETQPGVVDRLYWQLGGAAPDGASRMAVHGVIKAPYFAPQGQVAGAVLEDGTVIVIPPAAVEPFRDLLRAGSRLAAEGRGFTSDAGRALAAERVGEAADALRPVVVPAPDAQRRR